MTGNIAVARRWIAMDACLLECLFFSALIIHAPPLVSHSSSLPGASLGIKHKTLKPSTSYLGGGGSTAGGRGGGSASDVLPAGLLRDSLQVPKMR